MDAGTARPLSRAGALKRLLPFAGLVGLALATLVIEPRPHGQAALASVLLLALGGAAGPLLPRHRWPAWLEAVPPLAFLVPVILLREATGGSASGFAFLALLPVLWLALYGSWRQMLASVAAVAVVFVGPLVVIGAPHYAPVEWRRAALAVMVASLVGVTTHRLVNRLAERENEAARAARRLEGVLAAATEYCVVGTDTRGRIEVFNTGAERMLGWRAEEVLGRSCALVHDREELQVRADELGVPLLRALSAGLDRAASERRGWTYVRKDGSRLPVEMTVTALRSPAGEVTGYIGIAEDVSERRAAEGRLRDSEANLAAVARVLRGIQAGQDVRDAIVDGVLAAASADAVFLFEPDGRGRLVTTRVRGTGVPMVTIDPETEVSAVATTFLTGERLFLADPHGHPLVSQRLLDTVDVRSLVWEPIRGSDSTAGVLVVAWKQRVADLADSKAAAVFLLADKASLAFEHDEMVQRLARLAATDPLTGLSNRRAWDERLSLEMSRSSRDGKPLTIALLDLDHFKAFNDTYGHQAGDELLAGFAAAAGSTLRDVDLFARWGGEEFVLALPGCDAGAAPDVLERVRRSLPHGQTCSLGYVQWDGKESIETLLARADTAMYEAKRRGRDRMVAGLPRERHSEQAATLQPAG